MDGFHLDNPVLPSKHLLNRKGSPQTFDSWELLHHPKQIQRGNTVFAPWFDRTSETAITAAIEIPGTIEWLVMEGNYPLLKEGPWDQMKAFFDLSVYSRTMSHFWKHDCKKDG